MELMEIIYSVSGLLIVGLVSFWFKKFNDNQQEMIDSMNESKVVAVETKSNLSALKEKNEIIDMQLKKDMSKLAQDMSEFAKTIGVVNMTTQRHELQIKNLEDQHKIIAKELRKKVG